MTDDKREMGAAEFVRAVVGETGRLVMQRLADPSERELFRQANLELARYGLRLARLSDPEPLWLCACGPGAEWVFDMLTANEVLTSAPPRVWCKCARCGKREALLYYARPEEP